VEAVTDDRRPCTLGVPSTELTTCYCTGRPGCRWRAASDACVDCGNTDCLGDCGDVPLIVDAQLDARLEIL
jgi:hypothetical protein